MIMGDYWVPLSSSSPPIEGKITARMTGAREGARGFAVPLLGL
jgi:hypothetical protein